ncbi:MAG: hypothetical protein ACFFHD_08080 [Promethearchaeota archaeon]
MIFQEAFELFSYLFSNFPSFILLAFDIAILVFAIFIYRRNSYKYGLFLVISFIISIALTITYISIDYVEAIILKDKLYTFIGHLNYSILSWIFFGLKIVSLVYLFLTVYYAYKTHEKNRSGL